MGASVFEVEHNGLFYEFEYCSDGGSFVYMRMQRKRFCLILTPTCSQRVSCTLCERMKPPHRPDGMLGMLLSPDGIIADI